MESVSQDEQLFRNKLKITNITDIDDDQMNNNELRETLMTQQLLLCVLRTIYHIPHIL